MRFAIILLLSLFCIAGCDPLPPPPAPNPTSTSRDPFGNDEDEKRGEAQIKYGASRALVVGVSDYSALSKLEGPTFDAVEVASVLASRFGFDVTLLLDKAPPAGLPPGVKPVVQTITAAHLSAHLDALKTSVTPKDVLLFYFAGHGLPGCLVPADANLPSPTDRKTWQNTLAYPDLAGKLRAANAHHTLSVLDCCYSGTALADDRGLKPGVGVLSAPQLKIAERDNLARVFNRRAFQVITAGAGDEAVPDVTVVSRDYAKLAKDLEGHSPFTGVFLQGLRGLTGLPDGRILASDLGYYLSATLVGENVAFQSKQAPKYSAVAGEGDFLFIPTGKVLNPRLIAPLYIAGDEYAPLRESAADAVAQLVSGAPEGDRRELTAAAVPHLVRLLRDAVPGPRRAAANTLAWLAYLTEKTPPDEFRAMLQPLRALLDRKSEDRATRSHAARALGTLRRLEEPDTLASLRRYLAELEAEWATRLGSRVEPEEIRRQRAGILQGDSLWALDRRRFLDEWLVSEGFRILDERNRQHDRGKALLQRAQRYQNDNLIMEARFAAATAIGFAGHGGPLPDRTALLWPDSPEWVKSANILRSTPDVRLLWSGGGPVHHAGDIIRLRLRDGRTAASADERGDVALWNVDNGEVMGRMVIGAAVASMEWIPGSGGSIVIAAPDRLLQFDGTTQSASWPIAGVKALAVSPDGLTLAAGTSEGKINLITLKTGVVRECQGEGHVYAITALRWVDMELISGDEQGYLRRWKDGVETAKCEGHGRIDTLCIDAPRGRLIIGSGPRLQIQDLKSGEFRSWCELPMAPLPGGVFATPDGSAVIMCSTKSVLRINIEEGATAWSYDARPGRTIFSVDMSPDGKRLAFTEDTEIRFLDVDTGRPVTPPASLAFGIGAARFAPDGKSFVTFNRDAIQVWDAARGQLIRTLDAGVGTITSIAIRPDSAAIAVATEVTRITGDRARSIARVRLLSLADGSVLGESPESDGPVRGLAFSASMEHLAAGFGERLGLLDPRTASIRHLAPALPSPITGLAFSPASEWLGVTDQSGTIRIVQASDGVEVWMRYARGALQGPAFNRTGNMLAAGSFNGSLIVWAVPTGEELARFEGFKGQVSATAWSPDGKTICGGGIDNTIRCWSVDTQQQVLRLAAPDPVMSLEYSPDGSCVIAATRWGPVRLWHVGPAARKWKIPEPLDFPTEHLGWSPDGSQVLIGARGAAFVVDVRTGWIHKQFPAGGAVTDMALSSDGNTLAVAFGAGTVDIWNMADRSRRGSFQAHEGAKARVLFQGNEIFTTWGEGTHVLRWDLDGKKLGQLDRAQLNPWPYPLKGGELARSADGKMVARFVEGGLRVEHRVFDTLLWSTRHEGGIWVDQAGFTHDSALLVTRMCDGRTLVWDAKTGDILHSFATPRATILALSPTGRVAAIRTPDGSVSLHGLDGGLEPLSRTSIWMQIIDTEVVCPLLPRNDLRATSPAPLGNMASGSAMQLLRDEAPGEDLALCFLAGGNLDGAVRTLRPRAPEPAVRPWLGAVMQALEVQMTMLLSVKQINEAQWRFAQAEYLGGDASNYKGVFDLVEAYGRGDLKRAAEYLAKGLGLPEGTHTLLWIVTLERLGDAKGAAAALEVGQRLRVTALSDVTWDILSHYEGKMTEKELFRQAGAQPAVRGLTIGIAHFHLGLFRLAKGDEAGATRHFEDCLASLHTGLEAHLARIELRRLYEKKKAEK